MHVKFSEALFVYLLSITHKSPEFLGILGIYYLQNAHSKVTVEVGKC